MRKIALVALLCTFLNGLYAQCNLPKDKELVKSGIWIRVDATGEDTNVRHRIETAKDIIDDRNDKHTNSDPWVGINLQLVWGQLHDGTDYDDGFDYIEEALNIACANGLYVQLYIADKYQHHVSAVCPDSNSPCGCDLGEGNEDYYRGSTAPIDDKPFGPLNHDDFDISFNTNTDPDNPVECVAGSPVSYYEGVHSSTFRYARQQFIDRKDDGIWVRKYFSKRWNESVKAEWLYFWEQLGKRQGIRYHAALHSIITPESSNSFETEIIKDNNLAEPGGALGYRGGAAYVSYLNDISVELRKYFPDDVLIVNNTNWIYPNEKNDSSGEYYQKDAAKKYLDQNKRLIANGRKETIGWNSQDLVILNDNANITPIGRSYRDRGVYVQMDKFPEGLKFGMITSETNREFHGTHNTRKDILKGINKLGVSHLTFVSMGHSDDYADAIANANPSDYSFMPSVNDNDIDNDNLIDPVYYYHIKNRVTGAKLRLNSDQIDLAIGFANDNSQGASWKIEYETRNGKDFNSFQLFNKRTNELVRYNATGSSDLIGKVVKEADLSIKWASTFWRLRPADDDGYFYIENLKSGLDLRHDDIAKTLHQSSGLGRKSEWFFEKSTLVSSRINNNIDDSTKANNIMIFPNPASNIIEINQDVVGYARVYSISGRLIKKVKQNKIDISDLSKGVYFVQVNGNLIKIIKE